MNKPILDLNHPAILEELWEGAAFDTDIYKLLERYTQAQESGELQKNTPDTHKLAQDIYHHLTTTRNRNLITGKEQKILRKAVGGFFGMSTGSHAATTWIMESRADYIKIVDPDHISPSNLNRIRVGWSAVGKKKVDVVAEEINNISPFTQVIKTVKTDEKSTLSLIDGPPKIDFIVEAIDDLQAKVRLRQSAKDRHLPYLMATDVDDNVFLDVERYDLKPQPQLFNGRVKNIKKIDFDHLSLQQRIQISMQIVGFEHNSEAMLDTLAAIGKKVATWPQLGATAAMAGAVITTAVKKILLGENVQSGRYYLALNDLLDHDFNLSARQKTRQQLIENIYTRFGKP